MTEPTSDTPQPAAPVAANLRRHESVITRAERWELLNVSGAVVWLTGLSGSGKSTVAMEVERVLISEGQPAVVLDGDNLRHGLNIDLGFSDADRRENIRRVGEVALLFAEAGVVALVPVISPFRVDRDLVRSAVSGAGLRFIEVYVDTPIEECERRDPKGLYVKARAGELPGFTGIDSPYEPPSQPELVVTPADGDPEDQAHRVRAVLNDLSPGD